MNNKETAGGSLCTDEERLLLSRATELSRRGEDTAVALSFLTPREQRLVFEEMERQKSAYRLFLWGGYVGAERRLAIFLPLWLFDGEYCREGVFSKEREEYFLSLLSDMGMTELLTDLICTISLKGSRYVSLSHRDYLGALMALGIKRNVLGDIVVEDTAAVTFCERKACEFILEELKRAGRDKIICEKLSTDLSFRPERSFEKISSTIASPRIDGVVRALCSVSREEAAQLVIRGCCEVNYFTVKETDCRLFVGDILTVRGHGKFIIDSAEDVTRRGRLRLLARKYV